MRLYILAISIFVLVTGQSIAGEIHNAARTGDIEEIEKLLNSGIDVDDASSFGSALHFAVIGKQAAAIRALIDHDANVNVSSEALGTPLHAAAHYGATEIAKLLIDAGAQVNARGKFQFTPLHTAALKGNVEIVQALLEAGADAKAQAYSTGTGTFESGFFEPLQLSNKHGHLEVSELLRLAGGGAKPVEPAGHVIGSADPQRGRDLAYKRCNRCHILEAGDPASTSNFSGPAIIGIFGQAIAATDGFDYSPALSAFNGDWTGDRLYAFIRHPMLTVPGVHMPEVKQFSANDVADVVAYLKSVGK
ncbi:MAG: c-type cytochrome [Rhizobiaceae bacterium]|nr:c-type cytochrome [Rhizobiaceae bacterium]